MSQDIVSFNPLPPTQTPTSYSLNVSPIKLNIGMGFPQEPGSVLCNVPFIPLPPNPNPNPNPKPTYQSPKFHFLTTAAMKIKLQKMILQEHGSVIGHVPFTLQLPNPTPIPIPKSKTVKLVYPTVSSIKQNLGMMVLQEPRFVLSHFPLNSLPSNHTRTRNITLLEISLINITLMKMKVVMLVQRSGGSRRLPRAFTKHPSIFFSVGEGGGPRVSGARGSGITERVC